MPSAAAITHSVKSSREPVRATCQSSHGNSRRPTTSISTTNTPISPTVVARVRSTSPTSMDPGEAMTAASGGISTSTSTVTRSSTTSQPTAIRPFTESSWPRDSSARSSTTVLATDNANPNTMPADSGQPQSVASPAPSAVATAICTIAPGSAMRRTDSRSWNEKCSPTPNISSMTPISAS